MFLRTESPWCDSHVPPIHIVRLSSAAAGFARYGRVAALPLAIALSACELFRDAGTSVDVRVEPADTTVFIGDVVEVRRLVARNGGAFIASAEGSWNRVDPPQGSGIQPATQTLSGWFDSVAYLGARALGTASHELRIGSVSDVVTVTVEARPIALVPPLFAGAMKTCAFDTNGDPWCWGDTRVLGQGRAIAGPVREWTAPRFAALEPEFDAFCALESNGTPWCWMARPLLRGDGLANDPGFSSPKQPSGGHQFVELQASGSTVCALKASGELWCWGDDSSGELGNPEPTEQCVTLGVEHACATVPTLAAGGRLFRSFAVGTGSFACATDAVTGSVWCFGNNVDNRLGGPSAETCQDSRGTVLPCSRTPLLVDSVVEASALTAGAAFACAIDGAGETWCWGHNGHGELGDGTGEDRTGPVRVAGSLAFASIVAGSQHACGLTADGIAYCWGDAREGQTGSAGQACLHGSQPRQCEPAPVAVAGGHRFVSLVAGRWHTCGMRADGAVYCWGGNLSGQLGSGSFDPVASHVPALVIGTAP